MKDLKIITQADKSTDFLTLFACHVKVYTIIKEW